MKKIIIVLLTLFLAVFAFQCKEALDKVKGKATSEIKQKAMAELKKQAAKKCKGEANVKKCITDFIKKAQ